MKKIVSSVAYPLIFMMIFASCSRSNQNSLGTTTQDSFAKTGRNSTESALASNPSTLIEEKDAVDVDGSMSSDSNAPQRVSGYANVDGTKIILLSINPMIFDNKLLTYFKYAVGGDGSSFEVEYDTYQEWKFGITTGQQTAQNFDNEEGCIYVVRNAVVWPNGTYILFSEAEYNKYTILQKIETENDQVALSELKVECENLKERKIIDLWRLAQYQNDVSISMVVFENIGDELLAWLVLEDGSGFRYCDFPATLKDGVGWQPYDYGILGENAIRLIGTLQNEQGFVVYLTWYDFEGTYEYEIIYNLDNTSGYDIISARYIVP